MATVNQPGFGDIYIGNSTTTTTWQIIKATIVKDLQIWKRYKVNMIGGLVEMAIFIAVFGIFSGAANFRGFTISTKEMFIFFLGGLTLMFFMNTALFMPINSVTRDLYNGTLEYVYSTPSSRFAYFMGSILADFVIRMVFYIPMFSFLAWYSGAGLVNMANVFLVTLLLMGVLAAFGIMIASLAILWKQIGSVIGIVNILFQFMSGTFFPVTSLPLIGQWVSYAIPFTYAFDLVRYYSFNGNWETLFPVYMEWLILAAYGIFYAFFARILLRKVEGHAKNKGLHLL